MNEDTGQRMSGLDPQWEPGRPVVVIRSPWDEMLVGREGRIDSSTTDGLFKISFDSPRRTMFFRRGDLDVPRGQLQA